MSIRPIALLVFVAVFALCMRGVPAASTQDDLQQIRRAADQGDAKAQTRLATMFAMASCFRAPSSSTRVLEGRERSSK